jgi:PIN domain nuclease of toxin-antitoxin system
VTAILDTHTLIWAGQAQHRLGPMARTAFSNPDNVFLVSAATAWEIATKVRLGKLPEAKALEANFVTIVTEAGYKLVPITVDDALSAGRMAGAHRDPWDRMIAAQALALGIPVISIDPKLDAFGVRRLW